MKIVSLMSIASLSLTLYGAMGSSISVPAKEHMKYTFGNHKNHPVQKLEERQYLHSLAPMSEILIKNKLSTQGYIVNDIQLRDITRELVYQVNATDAAAKRLRLFVDPSNGAILKMEPLQ